MGWNSYSLSSSKDKQIRPIAKQMPAAARLMIPTSNPPGFGGRRELGGWPASSSHVRSFVAGLDFIQIEFFDHTALPWIVRSARNHHGFKQIEFFDHTGIKPIQLPARSPNLSLRREMGTIGERGMPI
jgi:hypothetical protein